MERTVVIKIFGDMAVGNTIKDAIIARLPLAKPLEPEQRCMVSGEIRAQRTAETLRADMHRTPVDYAQLMCDAELDYGEPLYEPTVLQKIGEALLIGCAVLVLAAQRFMAWEERRWRE